MHLPHLVEASVLGGCQVCSLPAGSICKATTLLPGLKLSTGRRRTGLPGSELGGENRLQGDRVLAYIPVVLSPQSAAVGECQCASGLRAFVFPPVAWEQQHEYRDSEERERESQYHLLVWKPESLVLSHFVSAPSLCFAMGPAFSTRGRKSWHGAAGQHGPCFPTSSVRTELCSSLGW